MKKQIEGETSRLTPEEEQGLILRAKAGDSEALGRIIEDNIQRIYSLAFSLSQNKYDAEEITQEVFLKAVRNIHNFRDESRIGTWLYRITVNTFLNMKRKKVFLSLKDSEANPNYSGIRGSTNDGSDNDLTASINRSIGNLSARERSVFILRHYENISTKEISAMLGISHRTARTLLYRAVNKLRSELSVPRASLKANRIRQ